MEWEPTESADVDCAATPFAMVALPRLAVPSKNVTVPVAEEGETAAVKVTLVEKAAGLADEVREVPVLIFWMDWVNAGEVPAPKLASPA